MKTYPLQRSDGTQFAFEVENTFISLEKISKLLFSVETVKEVTRAKGRDDRIFFKYANEPFVVYEPWGDNSRYWVGPVEPKASVADIAPLHQAFLQHQSMFAHLVQRAFNAKHG